MNLLLERGLSQIRSASIIAGSFVASSLWLEIGAQSRDHKTFSPLHWRLAGAVGRLITGNCF